MTLFKKMTSILMLTTIVLTGCAPSKTESPSSAPESSETRVVEHTMGITEITGTPTKIVTLFQGATDAAVAFGITPVGVVESWVEKPVYEYLKEDLADTVIIGAESQPNLEEIAKLKPDLIIGTKLRNEKVYSQLSQIAPTVTLESVFSFKDTVTLIGESTNQQDKATQLLSDWDARVLDFQEKIGVKLGDAWPLEISVLNFRADHARIYVAGYATDILNELGFSQPESQVKAAEEGKVVLSLTTMESIPSMNADTFFIFNEDTEEVLKTSEAWTSHPLWQNLDAIKNDQSYIVNLVDWNMGGGYITANNMLDQIYDHFELEK